MFQCPKLPESRPSGIRPAGRGCGVDQGAGTGDRPTLGCGQARPEAARADDRL